MNDEEIIVDVGVGDGKSALKGAPQPIMVMAWEVAMKNKTPQGVAVFVCFC